MLRASVYRVDRSGKWKRKKKNCLLKVLSIADRLIHSQINRPRTTRRATPSSFTLLFDHAPLSPSSSPPLSAPVSFSFAFLSGNKQLLSTFRPVKWEKATAVQLFASLTGFARISTTEMQGSEHTVPRYRRYFDVSETKTRIDGCWKLGRWCYDRQIVPHNGTVLISRRRILLYL